MINRLIWFVFFFLSINFTLFAHQKINLFDLYHHLDKSDYLKNSALEIEKERQLIKLHQMKNALLISLSTGNINYTHAFKANQLPANRIGVGPSFNFIPHNASGLSLNYAFNYQYQLSAPYPDLSHSFGLAWDITKLSRLEYGQQLNKLKLNLELKHLDHKNKKDNYYLEIIKNIRSIYETKKNILKAEEDQLKKKLELQEKKVEYPPYSRQVRQIENELLKIEYDIKKSEQALITSRQKFNVKYQVLIDDFDLAEERIGHFIEENKLELLEYPQFLKKITNYYQIRTIFSQLYTNKQELRTEANKLIPAISMNIDNTLKLNRAGNALENNTLSASVKISLALNDYISYKKNRDIKLLEQKVLTSKLDMEYKNLYLTYLTDFENYQACLNEMAYLEESIKLQEKVVRENEILLKQTIIKQQDYEFESIKLKALFFTFKSALLNCYHAFKIIDHKFVQAKIDRIRKTYENTQIKEN